MVKGLCLEDKEIILHYLVGPNDAISVQFSHSVVSNSLWPPVLQHARPLCPLPTPRVYSNSCPLSQWCHPTISSSVVPFSSCLQSFPASGSFQMSQWKETKEPLDESEKGEWKSWLKTQHSKTKIMAPGPITSWQIDGKNANSDRLFSWAPKSLWMVTVAMKLKDTWSLEKKPCQA